VAHAYSSTVCSASFNATNAVADAIAVAATDQFRMEDSLQFVRLDQSPFEYAPLPMLA
jgi:hypothetical protein